MIELVCWHTYEMSPHGGKCVGGSHSAQAQRLNCIPEASRQITSLVLPGLSVPCLRGPASESIVSYLSFYEVSIVTYRGREAESQCALDLV